MCHRGYWAEVKHTEQKNWELQTELYNNLIPKEVEKESIES